MPRLPAVHTFVLALLAALAIAITPEPALAIDPSFTQFETPSTEQLPDRCKTAAVSHRIDELKAAIGRLDRKIERMERAKTETLQAIYAARDPARRRALVGEFGVLGHWQDMWVSFNAFLKEQLRYYEGLPECGQRGRRGSWPGGLAIPTDVATVDPIDTTNICVEEKSRRWFGELVEQNRAHAEQRQATRNQLDQTLRQLDEAVAGGGAADRVENLRKEIRALLDAIIEREARIRSNNRLINSLRVPCPPDTRRSAVDPPRTAGGGEQAAAVPFDECGAATLAAINALRADPTGYAQSLRGVRGQAAAEARDFLAGRQPVAALAADPKLTAAALAHARDLAERDVVGHAGADGSGPLRRFQVQGHFVTLAGEVIAVSQSTGEGAVRQLVIDEGNPGGPHRKDLFNANFTLVGIACVRTRSHGQIVVINLSNAPMRRD